MSGLMGPVRRPRMKIALAIVVGLYLLALRAEPLLHHGFACHANTPTHCTACALQMTSSGVEDDSPIRGVILLPEAGKLLPDSRPRESRPLVTRTNDRSPPA
jgi:hypothetical protein